MDPQQLLDVALSAAGLAVEVHRHHLGRVDAAAWSEKGIADFVTYVDREAESAIVDRIRESFPGHGILAEEEATAPGAGPLRHVARDGWLWIIDPLDGTTNFLHQYPMYAASVAVACRGELVAGVVVSGATGEAWSAVRAGGAMKDGERIEVSAIDRLKHALIGTGFPFKALELLPRYVDQFQRVLQRSAGVRRAGSAAMDLCHVASGYFDGFWELSLAPWDVAAGTLIVREAGGTVTRLNGDDDVLGSGAILAGNADIHGALLELLHDEAPEERRITHTVEE